MLWFKKDPSRGVRREDEGENKYNMAAA